MNINEYLTYILQEVLPPLHRQSGHADMTTYNNIAYQQDNWRPKEYKVPTSNVITSNNGYSHTIGRIDQLQPTTSYLPSSTSRYSNRIPMTMFSSTNIPGPTPTVIVDTGDSTVVSSNFHVNHIDTILTAQNSSNGTIELGTLQREVEKLKQQSAAILSDHV